MKKGIITIMALFYLSITCGVEVNWHYCMGQWAETAWGHDTNEKCAKCGMTDKKGCCETVSHWVKVEDAHQMVKVQYDFTLVAALPIHEFHFLEEMPTATILPSDMERGPPPLTGKQLLQLHQVFRI